MAVQAQVSVTISEQEYDMVKTVREFDERRRMHVYNVIKSLKELPEGIPGKAFIQDLNQLRATLDDEEFEAFKQSLTVFDQIDPEAWR
jgi:hypothetical protein